MKYEWTLPIKLESVANKREHWSKAHSRAKKQKQVIKMLFLSEKPEISLPAHIKLTRVAPRPLDHQDNLRMAMKAILDEICNLIIPGLAAGRADSDPRLTFEYAQERGKPKEYALKIEIICEKIQSRCF